MCILYRTAAHSSKVELKQAPVKSKDKNMKKKVCSFAAQVMPVCHFFLF